MITVRLMGGLGNQMFQYAAGRAAALRRGSPLALDLGYLRKHPTPRDYELGCFDTRASLDGRLRTSIIERLFGSGAAIHHETRFTFDPTIVNPAGDSYLIGYFQSERYFKDCETQIRSDLKFLPEISARNADLLREIGAAAAVSVHVRRGDYVSDRNIGDFHGILDLGYYRAAVAQVAAREKSFRLFVFSDDPEWCKRHLQLGCPTTYVDGNAGRGFEDMRLMSRCRHHIIANSSFSWWGAWLNPDPDNLVVAPKRWFAEPSVITADLIPPRWLAL